MIAWFGPAVLVLLLSSSPQHSPDAGPGAVAIVLAEEFAAVATPRVTPQVAEARAEPRTGQLAEVRVLPRWRSVRDAGLPAPRAP